MGRVGLAVASESRPRTSPRVCYFALRYSECGMAAVLQTLAVLTFSGFLFSLSLGNDSPGLNVLSHKTTRRLRADTSLLYIFANLNRESSKSTFLSRWKIDFARSKRDVQGDRKSNRLTAFAWYEYRFENCTLRSQRIAMCNVGDIGGSFV